MLQSKLPERVTYESSKKLLPLRLFFYLYRNSPFTGFRTIFYIFQKSLSQVYEEISNFFHTYFYLLQVPKEVI